MSFKRIRHDEGKGEPRAASQRRALIAGDGDELVREVPLMLSCGPMRLLTMCTPGDEEAYAVGFLASEGYIDSAQDVASVRFLPAHSPIPGEQERCEREAQTSTVEVELRRQAPPEMVGRLARTHEMRPSCGVCGLNSADDLLRGIRALTPGQPSLATTRIDPILTAFQDAQTLFQSTGAAHAAGLFSPTGELLAFAEDVGRHNALDKAIGLALIAGQDLSKTIALLSGRAGYELVIKLLRVGCPIILSVSAPSALAFDLCQGAGATLMRVRSGRAPKLYWDSGRVDGQDVDTGS